MAAPGRKGPPTGAINIDEAEGLLSSLRCAPRLLIGVSGGPDSTALMHLAALLAENGLLPPVIVATVDHGLRPSSHDTAASVVAQAQGLGLDAYCLVWEGAKPATGIQEAARHERYRLLVGLARRLGDAHVVTAHTLDDQAETILLRMARGSGPAGLAGMRRTMWRDGVCHHRPLLSIGKQRLVETCEAGGWQYSEDPANVDPRFTRARLRGLLPALAREGLDADAFATLGHRLSRDEDALAGLADRLFEEVRLADDDGARVMTAVALLTQPAAVVLRVLAKAMTDFAKPGAPRLGRLEHLLEAMVKAHATGASLRRTLHGHIVVLSAAGLIHVSPERPRKRGFANDEHKER